MRSEKWRRGCRQNQRGGGPRNVNWRRWGRGGGGEFCGFATGPLIKMHKLSKCGEFDELSSLATLDAKCGPWTWTGERGQEGDWISLCMQSIFNYVAWAATAPLQRERERREWERKGEREKKKKKNLLAPKTFRKPNKCQNGGHLCQLLSNVGGYGRGKKRERGEWIRLWTALINSPLAQWTTFSAQVVPNAVGQTPSRIAATISTPHTPCGAPPPFLLLPRTKHKINFAVLLIKCCHMPRQGGGGAVMDMARLREAIHHQQQEQQAWANSQELDQNGADKQPPDAAHNKYATPRHDTPYSRHPLHTCSTHHGRYSPSLGLSTLDAHYKHVVVHWRHSNRQGVEPSGKIMKTFEDNDEVDKGGGGR